MGLIEGQVKRGATAINTIFRASTESIITLEAIPMSQESNISALNKEQKIELRTKIVTEAAKLIGIPYVFGAEWIDYTKLPTALDCSELVEGCYKIVGLNMPDGSQNQFDFTVPAPTPEIGDLAFFGRSAKPTQVYHVGLVFSDNEIIEARGLQPDASFDTGKVILRPRSKWVRYPNFLGFRAHPKLV